MLIRVFFVLLLLCTCRTAADAKGVDFDVLRGIPIQNNGRIKPLDTFSREVVFAVTGKERFEGREPMDVMIGWMADGKAAQEAAVINVSHRLVREPLGIPEGQARASMAELMKNPKLRQLAQEAMQRQQAGEAESETDKHILQLYSRITLLGNIINGDALTLVGAKNKGEAWESVVTLLGHPDHTTGAASESPQDHAVHDDVGAALRNLVDAHKAGDSAKFVDASGRLKAGLASLGGADYPTDAMMSRELEYNRLHPFGKAWLLYLAALLVLLAAAVLKNQTLYWGGFAIAVAGLIMHAYGFYLRCTISGRPPVTNMYESVIWVSFGAMVLALALEWAYRSRTVLMASCTAAVVCLVLADNTSAVLDPTINPLTPVLRSNFWLTIHVLTITLSYAAFLVAMAEGHVSLYNHAFHGENRALLRTLHLQIYRAIQVGVLLLATGTILGGVWANYSWGRFWGWDPKEVWALIALLGYLALLHGRFAGWLKDYGLAVGAVVAFLGVLMAWYGVNFVLGAGLHSYGFGDGGQIYVGLGVLADLAYVAVMVFLYKKRRAQEN
ncbi:MAG: cytochrome C biogenesis protein [Armatimonadetes bacterium]|nr:cytochrome C biogenesis protein [Armatimonadota bacterium]